MKIVAILASPHGRKGNTGRLLNHVLAGTKEEGAKTELFLLKYQEIAPCLGCNVCHIKGKCKQKDAFHALKEKILDAEGVIIASPNYIDNVSAQLKAFMDRCCGVVHLLSFEGRYGVAVVTSGGGPEKPIGEMIENFMIKTGIMPVGSVYATMRTISGDEFPEETIGAANALGRDLVRAIKEKRINGKAKKEMEKFRQRMKELVEFRKDEWPYEWKYWQKREER